jgi:hypothetical protein
MGHFLGRTRQNRGEPALFLSAFFRVAKLTLKAQKESRSEERLYI